MSELTSTECRDCKHAAGVDSPVGICCVVGAANFTDSDGNCLRFEPEPTANTEDGETGAKHTPWYVDNIENTRIRDAHGMTVCQVASLRKGGANFIVRACNQHDALTAERDALLAACKHALPIIRDEWEGTSAADDKTKPLIDAIALVENGQ